MSGDVPAERAGPVAGGTSPQGPVLALETATALGSVAVGRNGRILAEVGLGVAVRHSESLLPAVRFVLERARLTPADLTAIIAGAGPGSFTGVRIAGATAKGMVHALNVPLFAYSSLAGLAAGAGTTGRPVCALLDARRSEVFAGCYVFPEAGGMETLLAPCVIDVEDLADRLEHVSPVWVGDAALRFAEVLSGNGRVAAAPVAVPRAASLIWLAGRAPEAGRVQQPNAWTPDYVRPPGVTLPS